MVKKLFLLSLILIYGCATQSYSVRGPITGQKYSTNTSLINSDDPYDYYNYLYLGDGFKTECRQHYVNQTPDLPEEVKNSILIGKISIGMTEEQVIASWGKPKKIYSSSVSGNDHKKWSYSSHYLIFENGLLKSWQRK